MKLIEISSKSALSKSGLGYDYALNPYRGCEFGCIYCYAPDVLREPRMWGQFVDIKRNIPTILAKELKKRTKGVVGISTVTDAFQPVERRFEVTRRCLEQLLKFDFPISIQTKSDLILKYLDLFQQFSQIDIGITLTTMNEASRKVFEPRAASIQARLNVLKQLNAHGISTWLFIGPILPHITEQDIEALIQAAAHANVQEIHVDRLRLKAGTWKRIHTTLSKKAPELIEPFRNALWDSPTYFTDIEMRIMQLCKDSGIPCQLAFKQTVD